MHGVGSPCLQGEPKGGGEKFRLFSNPRTPLTNAPEMGYAEMGYNRVQEEKRDVARETA